MKSRRIKDFDTLKLLIVKENALVKLLDNHELVIEIASQEPIEMVNQNYVQDLQVHELLEDKIMEK